MVCHCGETKVSVEETFFLKSACNEENVLSFFFRPLFLSLGRGGKKETRQDKTRQKEILRFVYFDHSQTSFWLFRWKFERKHLTKERTVEKRHTTEDFKRLCVFFFLHHAVFFGLFFFFKKKARKQAGDLRRLWVVVVVMVMVVVVVVTTSPTPQHQQQQQQQQTNRFLSLVCDTKKKKKRRASGFWCVSLYFSRIFVFRA
jgi:hypothetical protein